MRAATAKGLVWRARGLVWVGGPGAEPRFFFTWQAVRNLNIGVYKTKYGGNATKVREEKLEQTIQEANIMPPPPPPTVRQSSRKRKPLANKTNTAVKGTEKRVSLGHPPESVCWWARRRLGVRNLLRTCNVHERA